jgi:SAM-dependent methyltransferase
MELNQESPRRRQNDGSRRARARGVEAGHPGARARRSGVFVLSAPGESDDSSSRAAPGLLLRRLISSYRITHAIHAAAQLRLADHLGDVPRSATELASLLGVHAPALGRLLRALVSIGVLANDWVGRFALTPLGACLRADSPTGMRSWALCEGAAYYQRAWLDLPHAVRLGETAFRHAHGMSFYQYLSQHAGNGEGFARAMVDFARLIAPELVSRYDFSSVRRIVDVGGNHGHLLIPILRANPALGGVLFDRPAAIDGARDAIRAATLSHRCEPVAGDFFAAVPAGGDLYLLSRVLMDCDDAQAVRLLRNCHQAMAPDGRVLIVQQIVPAHGSDAAGESLDAAMSDLNMLVLTGGRERNEAEYRDLLERAGFTLDRIIPTRALVSLIEGVRLAC